MEPTLPNIVILLRAILEDVTALEAEGDSSATLTRLRGNVENALLLALTLQESLRRV